jgi:hypothetical protein
VSGPEFWQTGMGKTFFEGTMPALAAAMKAIAAHLTKDTIEEARALEARLEQEFWEKAYCSALHRLGGDFSAKQSAEEAGELANQALEIWRERRAKMERITG